MDKERRQFKLSLTIKEHSGLPGAHAALALVSDDDTGVPVLAIEAGGFSPDAEGAGELADMLRDAADAIDDHLKRPREHTDTATLPVVKVKRPTFNPQPRGPRQ